MRFLFPFLIVLFIYSCRSNRHEKIPEFSVLLVDSTTVFSSAQIPSGKPFVIVYFSPDCRSCQEETADLLKNMERLRDVNFYFVTDDPFDRLKVFNEYYSMHKYTNILLALDFENSFTESIRPRGIPYTIIYDARKELRFVYNGGAHAETLIKSIATINKNKS